MRKLDSPDMEYQCDTSLALGLTIGRDGGGEPSSLSGGGSVLHKPSLTLSLSDDDAHGALLPKVNVGCGQLPERQSSSHSAVSSFSKVAHPCSSKEKGMAGEEAEMEKATSPGSDEDDDGGAKKKLRLTKEQSALLEDRFKEHSTLNPKQKQALAKQLNLRPRQVEVWFQNRRARTKLKQTEVDCEFLKMCCERLTDENRRLHRELQELKALRFASPPVYMQFPAATLNTCPSCERNASADVVHGSKGGPAAAASAGTAAGGGGFMVGPKLHFFNPFTHSATCLS